MGAETGSPLTQAALHVLLALADGEQHGYALMGEALALSRGRVRLGPGTLYRTLAELLDRGWISESARRDPEDERRRYYRLSASGRQVLARELERLSVLVEAGRRHKLLRRAGS